MTQAMTAIRSFPDAPPRARTGPRLGVSLRAVGSQLWVTLQRIGQRRAAVQLYALARRHTQTNPARAAELSLAAEACLRADANYLRP